MEKFDARDVTIMILYRGDSIQRLENLLEVVNALNVDLSTCIYIREASPYNIGILPKLVDRDVRYEFVEDDDPVLYKTCHFNEMLQRVTTPFVSIWDTDAIAYADAIKECILKLRDGSVQMALPYNGVCLDTSDMIRRLYLRTHDFGVLQRNLQKMGRLQPHFLTGGAVIMNRKIFLKLGAENEAYYGWGDDDFDRYIRFMNAGLKIYRSSSVLFHLSHPRGYNSEFDTMLRQLHSKGELNKTRRGFQK